LCRASTPFFLVDARQDVDGRDEPGHDGAANSSPKNEKTPRSFLRGVRRWDLDEAYFAFS
jgi:hypothetical protein